MALSLDPLGTGLGIMRPPQLRVWTTGVQRTRPGWLFILNLRFQVVHQGLRHGIPVERKEYHLRTKHDNSNPESGPMLIHRQTVAAIRATSFELGVICSSGTDRKTCVLLFFSWTPLTRIPVWCSNVKVALSQARLRRPD